MDAPRDTQAFAKALRRRMTLPEVMLWRELQGRKLVGLQFRKQRPVEPYVVDFYCASARLAVEVNGYGHGVGSQPERDQRRDDWLAEQGIKTLRLRAVDVLKSPFDAARTVLFVARGEI